MRHGVKFLLICILSGFVLVHPANADVSLAGLRQAVGQMQKAEAEESRKREAAFLAAEKRQLQRTSEAEARRDAAEARTATLDRQWQDNEKSVAELGLLRTQHQGNLGELFGVTRQVAGDAANAMEQSLLGAELGATTGGQERIAFLKRLAAAKTLPSITEMERLWFEIQREMTASGEVARFSAEVLELDGTNVAREEVVRIGTFSAVAGSAPLGYLPNRSILAELDGSLPRSFAASAARLGQAADNAGYLPAVVDPSRGALLGLYLQRPNLWDRIGHGGSVGYVILAVGTIGMLAGLYQYFYLVYMRRAVDAQVQDRSTPRRSNPLGRVLLALESVNRADCPVDLAKLRVSEAVLREVPTLERFQAFLKLVVAAGPLLGLIGTVIGMIITFKAITASGTSDPKLMAHGIGQAMIATVLGLGVAIPLLFVNAALGAASTRIAKVLNEEGHALLGVAPGSAQPGDTDPAPDSEAGTGPRTARGTRAAQHPQMDPAAG